MMVYQTSRWIAAWVLGGLMFAGFARADSLLAGGDAEPLVEDKWVEDACGKGKAAECPPRWSVGASALILHRETPDADVLVFDVLDPDANLNGEAFDFGVQGGFEVALRREPGDGGWPIFEARFFALDSWSADASAAMTPGNPIQINTAPPTFVLGQVTAVDASYASQLYNLEFNLGASLTENVKGLIGFRYVELDEDLNMAFAGTPVTYDVDVANRLYGVQVGLEYARCVNRLEVDLFGKVGLYGNAADHRTQVWTGAFLADAVGNTGSAAFLGELGVTGKYWLTDHLAAVGGYRVMWIEGVALASDQIAVTNLPGQSGIDSDGGVFYHGAVVGMELAW